ncbi:MAG: DNA polymerase IV [Planctomycetes bacterium]|nr:DNA polymerase IV [Planctomycetota bacterium]
MPSSSQSPKSKQINADLSAEELHPSWLKRKIIHIDMDCFFAAVEVLDNPKLRGKAVIVGGRSNRGVVCAASYEARKYGVKSAMPLFQAQKLCPKGEFLPVRMSRYQSISKDIQQIFRDITELIQPISLDEAFLDVTQSNSQHSYAMDIAREIKERIANEVGLVASAGVAPNKFLAKIASDYDKPDGFFVIRPHEITEFMKKLPIRRIWGVGKVMEQKLLDLGIHTSADFQKFPEDFLLNKFGKFGPELIKLSQGIDESSVKPYREPKSIGNENTFAHNLYDLGEIKEIIKKLCSKVSLRLKKKDYYCRGIQLKVKYADFDVITRSAMLEEPCDTEEIITQSALALISKTELGTRPARLVGVSLSHLQHCNEEPTLFHLLENPELSE